MQITPLTRNNATISNSLLHTERGKTIPAIVSYDDKGNIAPLYFRISGESLKVLRYVVLNRSLDKIITYECTLEDNGYAKPIIVKYYVESMCWLVPDSQRANMFLSNT